MPEQMNRRTFIRESVLTSAAGAMGMQAIAGAASAQGAEKKPAAKSPPTPKDALPKGKICNMPVSRLLLGGNLLTHYTHSRDLKYVYRLTEHYNTKEKIFETMALAEKHGINAVVIHTATGVMDMLKEYRTKRGGKIKWIVCPTAGIDASMKAYSQQVKQIVDDGVDAIYLWGVRADQLVAQGKVDLVARAVDIAKKCGVPSGVGAHGLKPVVECEKKKVNADFYIKTLHHHKYPSGPKPDELKKPYSEDPGYWCKDPAAVIEFMKGVKKPWIAYKVMAAGAISPTSAFKYSFQNGADFILAGMFDFEIREDVQIAKGQLARGVKRQRPWQG
ncbi:MAG: hypothetical protein ISS78_04335 [Phycisphaerae bacterium]|nr:hypothetical protein [Phycisphaerae bacterium]